MRLFKFLLIIISVCFLSNSYGMENNKEQLDTNLSHAQQLLESAKQIPGDIIYISAWGHFETPADLDKFKKQKIGRAFGHLNLAKSLAQPIVDDKTVDKITKDKALNILEQEKNIRAKDWENF